MCHARLPPPFPPSWQCPGNLQSARTATDSVPGKSSLRLAHISLCTKTGQHSESALFRLFIEGFIFFWLRALTNAGRPGAVSRRYLASEHRLVWNIKKFQGGTEDWRRGGRMRSLGFLCLFICRGRHQVPCDTVSPSVQHRQHQKRGWRPWPTKWLAAYASVGWSCVPDL